MNTKQLYYVLVLAHEASFSKAADTLNITQPSLSQYIKKIEKEVGQPLFDRTNGELRLTDAGRVYIEAGRKILDIERQMELEFSDLAADRTGSLIIGAAPYRAAGMLPEVAKRFKEIRPGMHLVVREGTTAELLDGIEHGEYDIALTLMPDDLRLFRCEKVTEEELVLAVPASFPKLKTVTVPDRRYPAVDVSAIDGRGMVMLTGAQFMQKQLENLAADFSLTVHPAAVVKSLTAQIEMVRAGVGIALVPSGIERFAAGRDIVFYSVAQTLPKRELVLIWRRDRRLSKAAEELKTVIKSIAW